MKGKYFTIPVQDWSLKNWSVCLAYLIVHVFAHHHACCTQVLKSVCNNRLWSEQTEYSPPSSWPPPASEVVNCHLQPTELCVNLPLPSNTVTEQQAAQLVWSKRKKKLASRHACVGLIQKTPLGVRGKSLKATLMDDNFGLFGNPNAARCLVYGI